jgi:sarcosine oxidase
MPQSRDVIVLGLGAMGSSAASHLAARGHRVVGFDRHTPPHSFGSSHGRTRIFRQAYFEDPRYVPLLARARDLWGELERESGQSLFQSAGMLSIGMPGGRLVQRTLESARRFHLRPEPRILVAEELRARWPAFVVPDDAAAVLEENAGHLAPEACVTAQLKKAVKLGAELHFGEPVLSWSAGAGSVTVRTAQGTWTAERLVIAAGPWAPEVLYEAGLPLKALRQTVFWLRPADPEPFREIPMFIFEAEEGTPMVYGFPLIGALDDGVKVAIHGTRALDGITAECTPETVDREIRPGDEAYLRQRLAATVPALAMGQTVRAETCLYTMTPDENFFLGQHPEHPEAIVAAGFSGHGFKFASVIGEIIADLVSEGKTNMEIAFLKPRNRPILP